MLSQVIIIFCVALVLSISLITCLGVVLTSIFSIHLNFKSRTINVYWMFSLLGAFIILLTIPLL